jgi:hypothetical protein
VNDATDRPAKAAKDASVLAVASQRNKRISPVCHFVALQQRILQENEAFSACDDDKYIFLV